MVELSLVQLEIAPAHANLVSKETIVKLLRDARLDPMEMFARITVLLLGAREDVVVFVRLDLVVITVNQRILVNTLPTVNHASTGEQ